MMYSTDVDKIISNAAQIARGMNSKEVCVPHIVAAAMQFGTVSSALEKSGVNIGTLKKDVDAECGKCPKLAESLAARYRDFGVDRKLRLSIDAQGILNKANQLAENPDMWKTSYVETSHLMMAMMGIGGCKSLDAHLNSEAEEHSQTLNKFLNELIKSEAKERRIKAKEVTISLSRNGSVEKKVKGNRPKNEISQFCSDMLAAAEEDDKPFVGRAAEMSALMQCLERRDKPNAILAGPPGVGKTDIVRGLAKKISAEDVPEQLKKVHL